MRKIAFWLSLVFIFVVPWEGVIEIPGIGTAAKMIGFTLAGFWLVTVLFTNRIRQPRPFHLLVFLFVLWNGLSIFWSADPGRTFTHLQRWIQLLALVIILWDLYTTRERLFAGLQAFVLGEYVGVGMAIQNFFAGDVYYNTYQRFSPAEQSNPDGFGIIVVLAIPVAWYLASSNSPLKMNRLLRVVNYAYIPAAFIGLSLSGTRTALLVSILAMAFGIATLTRLRMAARTGIFLLLAVVILNVLPYVQELRSFQRFSTTGSELAEGDLNQRTALWSDGLEAFVEHPVLGVGANMYRSINYLGKLAHNSFLSVLVELGIVGFVLFAAIVATAFLQAWRLPKWDAAFWLVLLLCWAVSALSLTYEYRKATWFIMSMAVISPAVIEHRAKVLPSVWRYGVNPHSRTSWQGE